MEDTTVSNSTAADAFTIPHSVQTSVDVSPLKGSRIFLDICAGAGYPLTEAMLQHECICFPVDMLIDAKMDLLDNSFFEPLLRICSSGMVGYGAAAPNCGEYSRLKLRDGGPPALRTPTFLDGLPNLNLNGQECFVLGIDIRSWGTRSLGATYKLDGLVGTHCETFHKILCLVFSEFSSMLIQSQLVQELAFGMHLPSYEIIGFQVPTPCGHP